MKIDDHLLAEYDWLTEGGTSPELAARQLGVSPATLEKALQRRTRDQRATTGAAS